MAYSKDKVTEADLKLLAAFHSLEKQPEVETAEDLVNYMKHVGSEYVKISGPPIEPAAVSMSASAKDPAASAKFPRISLFFGDSTKGEVTYQTWKYEILCLEAEDIFTEEQICMGIRRSAKGEAGSILRRMGYPNKIKDILQKFEATYGEIQTPEAILRQLYVCKQEDKETVISYASRVEDIFAQAVEVGAIEPHHEHSLKNIFYQGLQYPLKQMCSYPYYTIDDYDKFKVECRKVESEMKFMETKETKSKCHAANQKPEKTELGEVKELLQQMNERIKKLELEKEQASTSNDTPRGSYRGRRHHRGARNRGSDRGRGSYQPTRPTGTNTFTPSDQKDKQDDRYKDVTCYNCQKQGHIARYCPGNA